MFRDLLQFNQWFISKPWLTPVLLPVFWATASWMISIFGGWSSLAEVYRDTEGRTFLRVWRWRSGQFRFGMHYNNCLNFGADEQGLSISVVAFFRIGHPPLFVPWSQVTA